MLAILKPLKCGTCQSRFHDTNSVNSHVNSVHSAGIEEQRTTKSTEIYPQSKKVAQEQSNNTDSDREEQLTDSNNDQEYTIFPNFFAKADKVCVRLNDDTKWWNTKRQYTL